MLTSVESGNSDWPELHKLAHIGVVCFPQIQSFVSGECYERLV